MFFFSINTNEHIVITWYKSIETTEQMRMAITQTISPPYMDNICSRPFRPTVALGIVASSSIQSHSTTETRNYVRPEMSWARVFCRWILRIWPFYWDWILMYSHGESTHTTPFSLFRMEFFLTRLVCALCYRTCDQGIDLWVVSVSRIKSHFTQPEMYYLLLRLVCLQVFCCFFNPFPDHNQS